MASRKSPLRRKNKTTVAYKPTFSVRLTTCNKRTSSKTIHCPLFPKKVRLKFNRPAHLLQRPAQYLQEMIERDEVTVIDSQQAKRKRLYKERKVSEVESWKKLRSVLLKSAVEVEAPSVTNCYLCDVGNSYYRCTDCCPQTLCYTCLVQSHALQPLHLIEEWRPDIGIYWPKEVPGLRKFRVPEVIPPGCERRRKMTLIDYKGRTRYNCTIIYGVGTGTSDEALIHALVKLGFWPLTPTSPKKAISTEVLSLLHCLTLECQTSARGFVSALLRNQVENRRVIPKLESILRGEALPEYRLFWQALDRGPVSLLDEFKPWLRTCPACPKGFDEGSLVLSMDANFGLVHKHNSGKTYSTGSPMSDMFFLDQEKVDQFVDGYFQDAKDISQECSQFQAAEVVRSKNKAANLNVTGVFGSSCRHEVPNMFMDIRHGERLAYSVTVLKEVKDTLPKNVQLKLLYDIACTLKKHLKRRKQTELLKKVELAIPVFHSYGHKGECQITMNPRRLEGFGLTDGEQLERLWSYLRLFSKITKEQTPGHRKELLNMALLNFAQKKTDTMENTLIARYRKADSTFLATKQLVNTELKIASEHLSSTDQKETMVKLKADEEQFLSYLQTKNKKDKDTWQQVYSRELLTYYSLRAQLYSGLVQAQDAERVLETTKLIDQSAKKLQSFEKTHKFKRWEPTSKEYMGQLRLQEDERRSTLLSKLHRLLAEKQYHIETKRSNSDGQAKANRASQKLKSVSTSIKATVKTYNIGSSEALPSAYPSTLCTEDVVLDNEIFNSLHAQAGMTGVPLGIRRKILDQSFLHIRSDEEMKMLKTEMTRCYFHFCNLHSDTTAFLAQIDRTTAYGMGLHSISLRTVLWLEARLILMWKKIKPYTPDIPELPESYVANLSVQTMTSNDEPGSDSDNEEDLSQSESSDDESEIDSDVNEESSDVQIVFD